MRTQEDMRTFRLYEDKRNVPMSSFEKSLMIVGYIADIISKRKYCKSKGLKPYDQRTLYVGI